VRTLAESEAWAREHSAVLKVNFTEGVASLQVSGFVAYSNGATPIERALPELVSELEQQMRRHEDELRSKPTQP
jgi:hypothetical protein